MSIAHLDIFTASCSCWLIIEIDTWSSLQTPKVIEKPSHALQSWECAFGISCNRFKRISEFFLTFNPTSWSCFKHEMNIPWSKPLGIYLPYILSHHWLNSLPQELAFNICTLICYDYIANWILTCSFWILWVDCLGSCTHLGTWNEMRLLVTVQVILATEWVSNSLGPPAYRVGMLGRINWKECLVARILMLLVRGQIYMKSSTETCILGEPVCFLTLLWAYRPFLMPCVRTIWQ